MTSSPPKSICIIGAGPSGLSMLHALMSDSETAGYSIICFEQQSDWGGQWNYDWRTGFDKHGIPIHHSMHKDLWSNIPKECVEYPDYTHKDHFNVSIPSYPPRDVMRHYFVGRAKKHNLRQYIQFSTIVKECTYSNKQKRFTVKTTNLESNVITKHQFDNVVVCTGHFSYPNIPTWDGIETFTGRIVHSHDLRNVKDLKGKKILVIGTSYSAEDITAELYKNEIKATISWRTAPMDYVLPHQFNQVPELVKIKQNICYFKDDSKSDFDVIILCTGYKHNFPFMSAPLQLNTDNTLCPDGLYDGCVFIDNPRLFYIGMQEQFFTFTMFDAQAWLIRDIIHERINVPSKAYMQYQYENDKERSSVQVRVADDATPATDFYLSKLLYQANYIKSLISQTNYPKFNIDGVVQVFSECDSNKHNDLMRYRDQQHTSQITNEKAQEHSREWLIEDNNSIEHYIRQAYLPKHKNRFYRQF